MMQLLQHTDSEVHYVESHDYPPFLTEILQPYTTFLEALGTLVEEGEFEDPLCAVDLVRGLLAGLKNIDEKLATHKDVEQQQPSEFFIDLVLYNLSLSGIPKGEAQKAYEFIRNYDGERQPYLPEKQRDLAIRFEEYIKSLAKDFSNVIHNNSEPALEDTKSLIQEQIKSYIVSSIIGKLERFEQLYASKELSKLGNAVQFIEGFQAALTSYWHISSDPVGGFAQTILQEVAIETKGIAMRMNAVFHHLNDGADTTATINDSFDVDIIA